MEINKTILYSFPSLSPAPSARASNQPPGQAVPAFFQEGASEGIVRQVPADFINIQRINDTQNAVAQAQREVDKRFQELDDHIERIKKSLGQITTQFPPFPPGSQDRVRALRAYSYFRNMIDQLTLPPPDELPAGGRTVESLDPFAASGTEGKGSSGQIVDSNEAFAATGSS